MTTTVAAQVQVQGEGEGEGGKKSSAMVRSLRYYGREQLQLESVPSS